MCDGKARLPSVKRNLRWLPVVPGSWPIFKTPDYVAMSFKIFNVVVIDDFPQVWIRNYGCGDKERRSRRFVTKFLSEQIDKTKALGYKPLLKVRTRRQIRFEGWGRAKRYDFMHSPLHLVKLGTLVQWPKQVLHRDRMHLTPDRTLIENPRTNLTGEFQQTTWNR